MFYRVTLDRCRCHARCLLWLYFDVLSRITVGSVRVHQHRRAGGRRAREVEKLSGRRKPLPFVKAQCCRLRSDGLVRKHALFDQLLQSRRDAA